MRAIFYLVLICCYGLGLYFQMYGFDHLHPELLVLAAYSGAVGLLIDYAWRIRTSWFALLPLILAAEVTGDLLLNAGFPQASFIACLIGAALFPVYGLLFLARAKGLWHQERGIAIKFLILGLLVLPLFYWEYTTYYPLIYNKQALFFKIQFLVVFAWLLFLDFSTPFKQENLKIERDILRISLFVLSVWFFVRFLFK